MNKVAITIYLVISFIITMGLYAKNWDDRTLKQQAYHHGADKLYFYRQSQAIQNYYHAFVGLPSKAVLISLIIRVSETFESLQGFMFVLFKWIIYVSCVGYFLKVLAQLNMPALMSSVAPLMMLLHLPVLVYIPQVLRDDLIVSACLLGVASRLKMSVNRQYSERSLMPLALLILSLVSLFFLRPEYALIFFGMLLVEQPKRGLIILTIPIAMFSGFLLSNAVLVERIFSTITHVILFWDTGIGLNMVSGIRQMLFSPLPNNTLTVFMSEFVHREAAFWLHVTVPLSICLAVFYLINAKQLVIKFLSRDLVFFYICLFPLAIVVLSSMVLDDVKGPRQALFPAICLGLYGLYLMQAGVRINMNRREQ